MRDFNEINIIVAFLIVSSIVIFLVAKKKKWNKNQKQIGFGILLLFSLSLSVSIAIKGNLYLYYYHIGAMISLILPFVIVMLFVFSYYEKLKIKIVALVCMVAVLLTVGQFRDKHVNHIIPTGIHADLKFEEEWMFWINREVFDQNKITVIEQTFSGKDLEDIINYTEEICDVFYDMNTVLRNERKRTMEEFAYTKGYTHRMDENTLKLFKIDEESIANISFLDLKKMEILAESSQDSWKTLYGLYNSLYGENIEENLKCTVVLVEQNNITLPVLIGEVSGIYVGSLSDSKGANGDQCHLVKDFNKIN